MKFGKRLAAETGRRWPQQYIDYKACKRAIQQDVLSQGEHICQYNTNASHASSQYRGRSFSAAFFRCAVSKHLFMAVLNPHTIVAASKIFQR